MIMEIMISNIREAVLNNTKIIYSIIESFSKKEDNKRKNID